MYQDDLVTICYRKFKTPFISDDYDTVGFGTNEISFNFNSAPTDTWLDGKVLEDSFGDILR